MILMSCPGVESGKELAARLAQWFSERGVPILVNVVYAAAILLVGWLVAKIVSTAARKAASRAGRKTLFADLIVSVVSKTCWAVVIIMALGRLGVDVTPLVAGLGITGFIVGFAFQESLGNLASGMMIAINEPFKVGDFVSAGGHDGTVLEVNMMATVLSSPDNKRIVLPNKSVWGGPIVNFSALPTRRVDMKVGIAYGTDIEKAISVIREAVSSVPGVLAEPAPVVATAGLDESHVTVNIRPWAVSKDYWSVYSATLEAVKAALGKAGIEIPFPQITVHNA
jgi:small conductance mechanosensitive channel